METDIRRINFFDGLFLRQGEFLAEQLYHLHMRRRVHYMLFDQSGVVQVESGDLRITPTNPPTDKTFHVTAGMAISHRADLREGREIVLKENSATIDLAAQGISTGQEAFVAIHYEEALIEPQTGVEPNTETRVEEVAIITVHDTAIPWPPPPRSDGEPYVRLGRIAFDSMTVDQTERHTAVLRSGLIGGAPVPGGPTISAMNPASGEQGQSVPAQITGTNLSGATVTVSGTGIAISGVTTTATTIDFTLTIGGSATTDTRTITVNNGSGTATITFQVTAPVVTPVIAFFDPGEFSGQQGGQTVEIHGTDIRDPSLVPPFPVPATDTGIELTALGATLNVDAATIQVLADSGGNQRVEFQLPARHPSWSTSQEVSLTFQFGGGATSETYRYADPF